MSLFRMSPHEVDLIFAQALVKKYRYWLKRGYTEKLDQHRWHYQMALKKIREYEERLKSEEE